MASSNVAVLCNGVTKPLDFDQHQAVVGESWFHLDVNRMTFVYILLRPNVVFCTKSIPQELSQRIANRRLRTSLKKKPFRIVPDMLKDVTCRLAKIFTSVVLECLTEVGERRN